ncbi:MAG: nucleotidyltransferase domain-containing protein [Chloroflexi bacterium]|nr:nucleotidyltransferase domain-containing protein [Chloroflexota bacterium]
MPEYTAHDDPIVGQTVEQHLARIVAAIREQMEAQSIILYGSFGRGEGSVMLDSGRLTFLSDYEITVVTPSPFYRGLFAALSQQLTAELDVEVSVSWMRPGRLRTNQSQNLSLGRSKPTIAMYELKAGGQTIYGREMLTDGPIIDPRQISVRAGIRLLINRMIEALHYAPDHNSPQKDRLETVRWINKLILACNEALLLSWGEYHYSYAERGRRFSAVGVERLRALSLDALDMADIIERATSFKLRPTLDLFPGDTTSLWLRVSTAVDVVFRHLMAKELGISFDSYAQFPELFLKHAQVQASYNLYRLWPLPVPLDQKLVNAIKYLRQRRCPPRGYLTHFSITANLIVFALTPLLFQSWSENDALLTKNDLEIKRWLTVIGYQDMSFSDAKTERQALYQYLLWAWKNFCYN